VALPGAAILRIPGNDAKWKKEVAGGRNPRDIKVLLAREIVTRFHSAGAAERARADFEARFKHGATPRGHSGNYT